MSGTSLAVKIGTLVVGAGIFLVLLKKIKVLKKYGIISLLYVLLVSVILALPTLLLLSESNNEIKQLIIAQIIIIAIGTLHVLLAKKLLPWYSSKPFLMQVIFLICILLFGYLLSDISFTFFVESKAELVWTLSLFWFLVPVILNQSVNTLLEVPPKDFKKWQYPVGANVEDPTDEEMENPLVISFVFYKDTNTTEKTTFRAKAPVGMALGRLFYFFINDYNSRNPEAMISYINRESQQPNSWIFYKLRNKLMGTLKALDPEASIYANNIKENDVLVCTRFVLTEKSSENETTE
jgi:hypothetical protein